MTQKDGNGALFANRQPKDENSPQWVGDIKLQGQNFNLSGWEKTDRHGNRYFSVSVGRRFEARKEGAK